MLSPARMRASWPGLANCDGLKKSALTEDGGIGADRERQREDRDGGEAGSARDEAQSIRPILPQLRGGTPKPAAAFDGDVPIRRDPGAGCDIAEFTQGLCVRVVFRHACLHQVRDTHVDVKRELLADIVAHIIAFA